MEFARNDISVEQNIIRRFYQPPGMCIYTSEFSPVSRFRLRITSTEGLAIFAPVYCYIYRQYTYVQVTKLLSLSVARSSPADYLCVGERVGLRWSRRPRHFSNLTTGENTVLTPLLLHGQRLLQWCTLLYVHTHTEIRCTRIRSLKIICILDTERWMVIRFYHDGGYIMMMMVVFPTFWTSKN